MKKTTLLIMCLAISLISSGCVTMDSTATSKLIGKTITFTTEEAAPANFDSWTLFWQYPAVEEFDADLEYAVLLPDGTEYYVHDCGMVAQGGSVRSDFWSTMFKDTDNADKDPIAPFQGKHITIVFRATKGRIRFQEYGVGGFAFYQNGKDGKVDRNHPLKQIQAVLK